MNPLERWRAFWRKRKEAGFRVKVEPRGRSNSAYWILYSVDGGRTWREIIEGNAPGYLSDSPHLMNRDHPLLYLNFNQAVEEAKKFKTLSDVERYEAEKLAEFDKAYQRAVAVVEKRGKQVWISPCHTAQ